MELLLWIFNITAFSFFGIDKFCAKKGRFRISEKILLTLSLLGGIGAFLAMKLFHHKTKKPIFKVLVPVGVIINALFYVILINYL